MKRIILTLVLNAGVFCMYAQQQSSIEAEIRKLEDAERQAVLKKDTVALQKIWARDLIVNAPFNQVVLSGKSVSERPVIARMSYSSFTREIEQLLIRGDVVFSMGNEVVVPAGDNPKAGQSVKRRYTNIWIRENGSWKLAARHANVICE